MMNEIKVVQETDDSEITTVVINPSNPVNVVAVNFYREDIVHFCSVGEDDGCEVKPKFVHKDDKTDTACVTHRMEISPWRKKEFLMIEKVPSKVKSSEEILAEALQDEPELHEPEYATVDDDELGGIFKTPQS